MFGNSDIISAHILFFSFMYLNFLANQTSIQAGAKPNIKSTQFITLTKTVKYRTYYKPDYQT